MLLAHWESAMAGLLGDRVANARDPGTEDANEGPVAFAQKRPPDCRNRWP